MSKVSTVWVTKYALTKGVYSVDASISGKYAYYYPRGKGPIGVQLAPGQWHTNELDAIDKAYKIRDAKIVSLEKKIKELRSIEFVATKEASEDH